MVTKLCFITHRKRLKQQLIRYACILGKYLRFAFIKNMQRQKLPGAKLAPVPLKSAGANVSVALLNWCLCLRFKNVQRCYFGSLRFATPFLFE